MSSTIRTYRHSPTKAADPVGSLVDTEVDSDDGLFQVTVDTTGWAKGDYEVTITREYTTGGYAESAKSTPVAVASRSNYQQGVTEEAIADDFAVFDLHRIAGYKTIPTGITAGNPSANYKIVSTVVLSERGRVVKIGTWARATNSGNATDNLLSKGLIYSNSAGLPSALLHTSIEKTIITAPAWNEWTFTETVDLAADTYWVGCIAAALINGLRDTPPGYRTKYNADAYADGPTDPFGTVSGPSGDVTEAWWAEYIALTNVDYVIELARAGDACEAGLA